MNVSRQENYLASARLPTFSRYKKMVRQMRRISLTRALEYEYLTMLMLKGKLLDIGGGSKAGYRDLLSCDTYDSINIDPSAEPTWVVDAEQVFPCANVSYDVVISMNTFEHVYDIGFILNEMYRVLKHGGEFYAAVPFLFPIHAHPDDFFRPTPTWLFQTLAAIRFKNIVITPLAWGPFSTGMVCSGTPGPGKGLRKKAALFLDLLYTTVQTNRRSSDVFDKAMVRCATAFFIKAIK